MDFSAAVILAGLILALLWFIVKSRRKYNLPPGPTALPLIGNLPQLDKNTPFRSFVEVRKRLFIIWFWTQTLNAYHLLQRNNLSKSVYFPKRVHLFLAEQDLWACDDFAPGLAADGCSGGIRRREGGSGGPGWGLHRQRAAPVSAQSYKRLR